MATIKLTPDFKEFLKLLNSEKVEWLLIGGYAVALYGYIRPTKDIDVWISIAPGNLPRVIAVFEKFGIPRGSLKPESFTGEQTVFRMGLPPNRLEVITRIAGVEFTDCYARRSTMEVDGIEVGVIDFEDLRKNKSSTGRAKDLADVDTLDKARRRGGK